MEESIAELISMPPQYVEATLSVVSSRRLAAGRRVQAQNARVAVDYVVTIPASAPASESIPDASQVTQALASTTAAADMTALTTAKVEQKVGAGVYSVTVESISQPRVVVPPEIDPGLDAAVTDAMAADGGGMSSGASLAIGVVVGVLVGAGAFALWYSVLRKDDRCLKLFQRPDVGSDGFDDAEAACQAGPQPRASKFAAEVAEAGEADIEMPVPEEEAAPHPRSSKFAAKLAEACEADPEMPPVEEKDEEEEACRQEGASDAVAGEAEQVQLRIDAPELAASSSRGDPAAVAGVGSLDEGAEAANSSKGDPAAAAGAGSLDEGAEAAKESAWAKKLKEPTAVHPSPTSIEVSVPQASDQPSGLDQEEDDGSLFWTEEREGEAPPAEDCEEDEGSLFWTEEREREEPAEEDDGSIFWTEEQREAPPAEEDDCSVFWTEEQQGEALAAEDEQAWGII